MTAFMVRHALALSALLLVNPMGLPPGHALTIYRIGGIELPPPEQASEPGVDFQQLRWDDVDDDKFGSTLLV